MASDLPAHTSQREVVYESVESLRVQIKEIEDKWNDEFNLLETVRKDKEELEQTLRVLQTLVEYEQAATLKMEAMLKETRDALGIPDEASCSTAETAYDPSRSTGSSSSGDSSVLEFDLVYNPYAALKVPPETPLVSSPLSLSDGDDQVIAVPPLPPTTVRPTSKPKRSPNSNWKSRITSILISTNNHNRTNSPASSPPSVNGAAPFSDDADSHDTKPKRAAVPRKRSSQGAENHGTIGWRRNMGSGGNKFANRANRDINRKKSKDLASVQQS